MISGHEFENVVYDRVDELLGWVVVDIVLAAETSCTTALWNAIWPKFRFDDPVIAARQLGRTEVRQ
jgi:hypothetical protein